MTERFCDFVARHRAAIMWAFIGHLLLVHYVWLGYTSWDGLSYRVPSMVELAQFGHLGTEKYPHWALTAFRPFLELINVPFLYLFGLPGLYLSGGAVLYPLAIAAVYLFVRELSGSARIAVFGALAYALMPVVNEQAFSGYTDFAVTACLGFFIFSLLRLRRARTWASFVLVTLATVLFTMSRQQAPYVSLFYFPVLAYCVFVRREGRRFRIVDARHLWLAVAAFAIGLAPAVATHVWRYITFGNPIYPYEFSVLGVRIGTNFQETFQTSCTNAGMTEYSLAGFVGSFVRGWLWPRVVPHAFSDSRHLGGGLFLLISLGLLPFIWRRVNRTSWLVIGMLMFASLLVRDFWLPRYSYGLMLTISLLIGTGLTHLSAAGKKLGFWAVMALVLVHGVRPEWDLFVAIPHDEFVSRLDLAGSRHFVPGRGAMTVMPDLDAKIAAVNVQHHFFLPLYGSRLSNRILGSIPEDKPEKLCERIRGFGPDALFIDDKDSSHICPRVCVWPTVGHCRLYRLMRPDEEKAASK